MLPNQMRLLDMAKAGQLALEAIQGLDEDAFGGDLTAMMAVVEQLTALRDAINQLSDGFRQEHRTEAWQRIVEACYYDTVNGIGLVISEPDILWPVLQQDMPDLLKQLEPLLPEANG